MEDHEEPKVEIRVVREIVRGMMDRPERAKVTLQRPDRYHLGQDFEQWINRFIQYCVATTGHEPASPELILASLDEEAYEVYTHLGVEEGQGVAELVRILAQRFKKKTSVTAYRIQFRELQHGKEEEIETFADRINKVAKKAFPDRQVLIQELVRDQLILGMREPEMRERLLGEDLPRVEDVVRRSIQLTEARKLSKSLKDTGSGEGKEDLMDRRVDDRVRGVERAIEELAIGMTKLTQATRQQEVREPLRCYSCGRSGHIARTCPERMVQGTPDMVGPPCNQGHAPSNIAPRPFVCYSCGEVGHKAMDCPKSRPQGTAASYQRPVSRGCFNCGGQGHLARECRLPVQHLGNGVAVRPGGTSQPRTGASNQM